MQSLNPVPQIPVNPNPVMPNPTPVMPNPVVSTPTALNPNMAMPDSTQQSATPLTPEPKKSNFFLIFVIVVVLTLVIGIAVGYYLSSTNNIPDNLIPGATQTPEPTTNMEEPTATPEASNNSEVSPTPTSDTVQLSKSYSTTVLPWDYSFNYPSTWTPEEISNQTGSLTISFAKDHTGCASAEVICSMVFAVNVSAEMIDPAVATQLSSEAIVLQNEGPATLTLYQNVSNGSHFYMVPIRNGWVLANVASGQDEAAATLFRQILASYVSEESADAM
jgi:cytoskeletal protein RodZ